VPLHGWSSAHPIQNPKFKIQNLKSTCANPDGLYPKLRLGKLNDSCYQPRKIDLVNHTPEAELMPGAVDWRRKGDRPHPQHQI